MEDLIIELGIEGFEPEKQERIIDELNMRVGEAIINGLSEAQVGEYEAIINGDQAVIDAWLANNDPGYADTIAYQQLAEGVENDPDKVPADKVYTSMAWIEKNSPNLSETVATIKADLKANLAQFE
jgi:hypothetical protein